MTDNGLESKAGIGRAAGAAGAAVRRVAGRGKFDANAHPRDHKGRFIEVGAEVRMWGGARGIAKRNVGGGFIEVEMPDKSLRRVKAGQVEVIKRPDGKTPTGAANAAPKAMKVEAPDPGAHDFTPDTPANRVPAKDLKQGQAVLLYGQDADGNATRKIGLVHSVTPEDNGDLRVEIGDGEIYTDGDALARHLPAEKLNALREAVARGDGEAARKAQEEILAEVTKADEELNTPDVPETPGLGPAPQAPEANAPAGETVTPTDLAKGDRVSFTIDVTKDNAARFEGGKNPPKPGQQVTIRGTVEQVQDEMFGGQTVRLRSQGAQWQAHGGGGALVGDSLDWPLEEDHQVTKTGRADAAAKPAGGRGGPQQVGPQTGLFSDMGTHESGTQDLFTAAENDTPEPAPAPKPKPERVQAPTPTPAEQKPAVPEQETATPPAREAAPETPDAAPQAGAPKQAADSEPKATATRKGKKTRYAVEFEGDTYTRETARTYNYVGIVQAASDGRRWSTWSASAENAARGGLTPGERDAGVRVVKVIPLVQPDEPNGHDAPNVPEKVAAKTPDAPAAPEVNAPHASTDDGTPPSPEGMTPERRAHLVASIEEQAADYARTGSPGRYIAEIEGKQGRPRPGETDWVEAYIAAHPEVLEFSRQERNRRRQERLAREKETQARVRELSSQARKLYNAGDFDGAERLVDEAEALSPGDGRWASIRRTIVEERALAAFHAAAAEANAPEAGANLPEYERTNFRTLRPGDTVRLKQRGGGRTEPLTISEIKPDGSQSGELIFAVPGKKRPRVIRVFSADGDDIERLVTPERRRELVEQAAARGGVPGTLGDVQPGDRVYVTDMMTDDLRMDLYGDRAPKHGEDITWTGIATGVDQGRGVVRVEQESLRWETADGRSGTAPDWSAILAPEGQVFVRVPGDGKTDAPDAPNAPEANAPDAPNTPNAPDEMLPPKGIYETRDQSRINDAVTAYRQALQGDDERAMLDAWAELRKILDEDQTFGEFDSPQRHETERILSVGRDALAAWDEAHREQLRAERTRRERASRATQDAIRLARNGDMDAALEAIDEAARDNPDLMDWDAERSKVRKAGAEVLHRAQAMQKGSDAYEAHQAGRHDDALRLVDEGEKLDPQAEDWNAIRAEIRGAQERAAAENAPEAPNVPDDAPNAPEAREVRQDGPEAWLSPETGVFDAEQERHLSDARESMDKAIADGDATAVWAGYLRITTRAREAAGHDETRKAEAERLAGQAQQRFMDAVARINAERAAGEYPVPNYETVRPHQVREGDTITLPDGQAMTVTSVRVSEHYQGIATEFDIEGVSLDGEDRPVGHSKVPRHAVISRSITDERADGLRRELEAMRADLVPYSDLKPGDQVIYDTFNRFTGRRDLVAEQGKAPKFGAPMRLIGRVERTGLTDMSKLGMPPSGRWTTDKGSGMYVGGHGLSLNERLMVYRLRGGDSNNVDTDRDGSATVRGTMRAPKTGPAPDTGALDEQVREAGAPVLGDVPSDRAGGDGESGRVLSGAGRTGGSGNRGTGGGHGRPDEAGSDVRAAAGGHRLSDVAGAGEGPRRAGVRGEGARDRGPGDVAGQAFRPTSQADLAPAGEKAKARSNIGAVRLLRELQATGRPATDDEKRILARWSGWGSLPVVLEDRPVRTSKKFKKDGKFDADAYDRAVKRWESFAPERDELRAMLGEEEWKAARRNTLNAHYTDASLVSAVWDAVEKLGFDGGNVLEPGSGVGTFVGMAPERAHMTGVELEPTTAAISQHIYPDANILNESFADTRLPENAFDAVVGNVPFGDFKLVDSKYNKGEKHSIHNHFILKSLALTKPGGIVAVITSRYTMDSQDSTSRREMAKYGDLVGAVRLPSGAHRKAAGTDVVTDLLIFRKRGPNDPPGDMSWVDAPQMDVNGASLPVNTYFQQHPEQVLGEMTTGRGQFTDKDLIVKGNADAAAGMRSALDRVVADAEATGRTFQRSEDGPAERIQVAKRGQAKHDGALHMREDGTFTQVEDGQVVTLDVHPEHREQLAKLVGIRDVARSLLDEEAATSTDTPELTALRRELNRQYNAYVREHGALSKKGNKRFTPAEAKTRAEVEGRKTGDDDFVPTAMGHAWSDPAMALVFALDDYDPDTKKTRKADILSKRVTSAREEITHTDDPGDALAIVLDRTGGLVDIEQIADLLGVDTATARDALVGRVYEIPPGDNDLGTSGVLVSQRLATAADYLSGNVRRKLEAARAAAEEDPRFAPNVAALEAVLPRDLTPGEIDARMGASWIPEDVIEQFVSELVGQRVIVRHPGGSTWVVDGPGKENDLASAVWGTPKRPAPMIAEALLKQQTIKVTTTIDGVTYPDAEGTIAAQQKAQEMSDRFSEWVWEDEARAEMLARRYNDAFNSIVLRSYDGVELRLPGMAKGPDWARPHQKAAVARILNEPAVLLAHEVGAGKTAEMVIGAMELRRTGLAKKPAIVVPNHMLEQFTREFLELYPGAKILAAGTKDLEKDKRRQFVARAATGDWDAVILTQKAFEKIDMRPDSQRKYLESELDRIRAQIARAKEWGEDDNRALKQVEKALARAEEKIKSKLDGKKDAGNVYFENTGIDYLMVDEAHMFKNLRTPSRIEGAGIDGSDRASDLHMKLHHLRENSTSGRIVTVATGTDIANSVTEAEVMMRYARPDLLEAAGIDDFDTWAATFGDVVTDVEMKPDGNGFRMKARFARFRNVPELLRMYRVFADVKTAEDLKLPTPKVRRDKNGNRGETIVVPASESQLAYIKELGARAEKIRSGGVDPSEDNMLKISGDGKRAALDMRLLDPTHDDGGGKINVAADHIAEIYNESKDWKYPIHKGTDELHGTSGGLQIVFMDQGTPKPKGGGKPKKVKGVKTPASDLQVGDWINDYSTGTRVQIVGISQDDYPHLKFEFQGESRQTFSYSVRADNGSTLEKIPAPKPVDPDAPAVVGDGDTSTWAAYDEMKAQLVARGIPADKIRYIHEANTDQQKAKLFEDARTGKIAVLIGSTEKMGTGTNVQARAVALHHMDCPWRPADLAQREGRVERQGNFNKDLHNKEVRILRYVTEGTFDGYSWQTVERKAKFIAQMKKGDLDQREIEDIGDNALSMAEVKALAAGNPYLLDKAKADAEASRLEKAARAHARTQATLAQKIDRLGEDIDKARENIAVWEAALAQRVDTRAEGAFRVRIGDVETDTRADAYEPLLGAVREVLDGPYKEGDRKQIGEIGGHPIYVEKARIIRGTNTFQGVLVGFDWPGGMKTYIGATELGDGAGRGIMATLESRLDNLDKQVSAGHTSIETMTEAREKARAVTGRPYKYADLLAKWQARAKLLDEILKTEARIEELAPSNKDKPEHEQSEDFRTAKAELVVLKASLDVMRPADSHNPTVEPDHDLDVEMPDITPHVGQDDEGLPVVTHTVDDLSPDVPAPADVTAPDAAAPEAPSVPVAPVEAPRRTSRRLGGSRQRRRTEEPAERPMGTTEARDIAEGDWYEDDGHFYRVRSIDKTGDRVVMDVESRDGQVQEVELDRRDTVERIPAPADDADVPDAVEEAHAETTPSKVTGRTPGMVGRDDLMPGDRIHITLDEGGVRGGPGAHRMAVRDRREWTGTIPGDYTPGEPVRLVDVIEREGNQPPRHIAEPDAVHLDDEVYRMDDAAGAADAAEAAAIRAGQDAQREANAADAAERQSAMATESGGDHLARSMSSFKGIAREVFGGGRPVEDVEAAWLEADAAMAAAQETSADWMEAAWLKTQRANIAAELARVGGDRGRARQAGAAREEAMAEEAARAVDDGLPIDTPTTEVRPGDRIDTPDGAKTVTVEKVETVEGVTFTTTRDDEDRTQITASKPDAPVKKRSGGRKPMTLEPAEVGDLGEGDWLMVDDHPMQITGIERDGEWATVLVVGPDGTARRLDYRNTETVQKALNVRKRRPRKSAEPGERKPRVRKPVTLEDGTSAARVRLRTDIRKRVLGLNLDAEDSDASDTVREAAARLRASKPLSAEQMRALATHLRGMADDPDMPAATKRSLGRTAQWVDASFAKLSGYPEPPHTPGRVTLSKAHAENLVSGDVIALAEPDGSVTQARVTGVRSLKGFPVVNVSVEHHDGRKDQRVLAAGVDVWVMPDLPADREVPPAPDTPGAPVERVRREHITPNRLEVGDRIAHPIESSRDPNPEITAIRKTSREFDATDTWQVRLEGSDGGADVVTITTQGYPSVVRTGRGHLSDSQPWDRVLPDAAGEPVTVGDVQRGDLVRVRRADGSEVEGTVEHLVPIQGDGGATVGVAASVRTLADTSEMVPVFDGDGATIHRVAPAVENVRHGVDTVMRRRDSRAKQRKAMAVLADAETGLYRSAAGSILADLDTKLVHPPGDDGSGMEVWATAGDVVEAAWKRLDADQVARELVDTLGVEDDAQAAEMVKRVKPLIRQIHEEAADNMIASIAQIDPLPGETHDRALRDMIAQFRDMPPMYAKVGRDLASWFEHAETTNAPAPEMPAPDAAGLGERMAAYRKALPGDLGMLGHRKVNRPVFKALDLHDLNDNVQPEMDTITAHVPDMADDGGPGEHAMKHLAIVKAAGADIDRVLSERLDGDDTYREALAEVEATRAHAEEMEAKIGAKKVAGKRITAREAEELASARWSRDAARDRATILRKQHVIDLLSQVRDMGGVDLAFTRNGTPAQDNRYGDPVVDSLRHAQEIYPADWLALLAQRGPIELRNGDRGGYDPDAHAIVFHSAERHEAERAASHELGHAMETAVPGLREAQEAYLWERSSHGQIGERERPDMAPILGKENEVGYPDAFPNEYTGRTYGGNNYEIFTTGIEDLMTGGGYLDDDFRQWLLGTMATLGTDASGPQRDPLNGADLSSMSVDDLRALLDRLEWGSAAYQRVMAELAKRDHQDDPLKGLNLDTMDLGELVNLMGRVDDPYSIARLTEAADRRESADREQEAKDARIDELVATGRYSYAEAWAEVNGVSEETLAKQERAARFGGNDRRPGETGDQMVERHYRDWQASQFLAADAATKGYLLNRAGKAAGIDARSLFQGSWERAKKYASDELLNWWEDHGWMNKTEFRAQMLGRERDVRAAKTSREGRR
ncbi:Eco57I restriction-modification methylase domain-containing protein (plasmid) [Microtetraspora malaysiensis]|uniref:Eco57I restriction-modification methylase domain-containing protein n=1 Tax=Microtetraspora malaysiensis TaxID=161358 RepID=UPI003D911E30